MVLEVIDTERNRELHKFLCVENKRFPFSKRTDLTSTHSSALTKSSVNQLLGRLFVLFVINKLTCFAQNYLRWHTNLAHGVLVSQWNTGRLLTFKNEPIIKANLNI